MRIRGTVAIFAALMVPLLAEAALACTCSPVAEPCEAYWEASAVFSGTVVEAVEITVEVPWGDETLRYSQRLVRFNVLDAYRGAAPGSAEVLTGMADSDCGYPFLVGENYLVYGFRVAGDERLRAHICSRTRPLADASADLEYIRGLSRADTPGRVFGVATLYGESADGGQPIYIGPLENSKIALVGGGKRYVVSTDALGRFEFNDVAQGSYVLKPAASDSAYAPRKRVVVRTASCLRTDVKVVQGSSAHTLLGEDERAGL
jgi:hypothetical protein